MKYYLYENRKDVFLDVFYPGAIGRGLPATPAGLQIPKPDHNGALFPAVIICPGGGYRIIGTTEARPVSDKFTDAGYAAFILHYTVGDQAVFGKSGWSDFPPVTDLITALSVLQKRADDFGIDASRIVLAGFSAGGHLCAASCFSGVLSEAGRLPKALLLTYPMGGGPDSGGAGKRQPDFDIARMPYADDPAVKNLPVFLWHAKDDEIVPFEAGVRLDARLSAEGIPHLFLVYDHGIHARPFFDPDWFYKALDWLAGL